MRHVQNLEYLRSVGVTHVLNTAERHVPVNPAKYPLHDISYFGFHVDDHPSSNISRYVTSVRQTGMSFFGNSTVPGLITTIC